MRVAYIVLLIFFLIYLIGSSSKKKKQRAVHWPDAAGQDPAVKTENDVQVSPEGSSVESESAETHEAHLIGCDTEGENEAEHARHLAEADHETSRIEVMRRKEAPHTSAYKPDAKALRRAVITREILDPPVALRERGR